LHLFAALPHFAGGLMISSAVALDRKFGKRVSDPINSLYSTLTFDSTSKWKSSFIAGLLFIATLAWSLFGFGEVLHTSISPFENAKRFFEGTGLMWFMIAGFLIGAGTKLSGGGLTKLAFYGVPKFDARSMMSAGIVLFVGILTATLRSDLFFLRGPNFTKFVNEHFDFRLSFIFPLTMLFINLYRNFQDRTSVKEILTSFGIGSLLGAGMLSAGLARRHHVLDFMSLNRSWDISLGFVFAGALVGNILLMKYFGLQTDESDEKESSHRLGTIRMLIGSILFGIGLGVTGLTPGSGLLVSPVYLPQIALFFLPPIIAGQFSAGFINKLFFHEKKGLKAE